VDPVRLSPVAKTDINTRTLGVHRSSRRRVEERNHKGLCSEEVPPNGSAVEGLQSDDLLRHFHNTSLVITSGHANVAFEAPSIDAGA
jgi:hypothetical protein